MTKHAIRLNSSLGLFRGEQLLANKAFTQNLSAGSFMYTDHQVCLLAKSRLGHRQSYLDVFAAVLRKRGIESFVTHKPWVALTNPGASVVMMIEEFPLGAHIIMMVRSFLGKPTVGLLFRSREVVASGSLRMRCKRLALRLVRRRPFATVFTILPHALLGDIDPLSKAGIDDPQLWDIPLLAPTGGPTALSGRAVSEAGGRPIILFAGGLSESKGLDKVTSLVQSKNFTDAYFLVAAGKLADSDDAAETMRRADCLLEDRYISDEELFSLYGVATFAWAAYPSSYDQASGIFGRAVQFGRIPIVRKGSLIERYAEMLNVEVVSINWFDDVDAIVAELTVACSDAEPEAATRQRLERNGAAIAEAVVGPRR